MNDEERNEKLGSLYKSALTFLNGKVSEGKKDGDTGHPLNRGDVMLLVMMIDRELPAAPSDWKEPFNGRRLAAIREKLGNFAREAPEKTKEEAQQFRE